ncbi:MAG: prepilin-type N-terminal cleavage/methylation domain-containing protein [Xanthomonadales bacterium]|nr:prepilin-type N-terminal cleavage/methylation domain-containing protein [Xanthomonadales bacterium]
MYALTHRPKLARGFTLIEILVVMVLIGLMVSMVGLSLSKSVSRAEVRNASRDVLSALRYTRTQAIVTHSEQVLMVDLENRTISVPGKKPIKLPKGIELGMTTALREQQSETLAGIRFFPDGGSTGGKLFLTVGEREFIIHIQWLTGEAKLVKS